MKRLITFLLLLTGLTAGATNMTNYPIAVGPTNGQLILISDVAGKTNYNVRVDDLKMYDNLGATTLRPVFTRCSDGADSGSAINTPSSVAAVGTNSFRIQRYCSATCNGLVFVYGNSAGNFQGTNYLNVQVVVEDSLGTEYPVMFGGQSNVVINPGGFAQSDPVALVVTNGDFIWERVCAWATNTFGAVQGTYYLGLNQQLPGEGRTNWNAVWYGAFSSAGASNHTPAYMANLVLGNVPVTKDAVFLLGDSIAVGYGTYTDYGIVLGLGPLPFGGNYPHTLSASSGDTVLNELQNTNMWLRQRMLQGCTMVLSESSINNLGYGLTTCSNSLVQLWTKFNQMGLKVWQTTLTPNTTSSDGWTTLAGQTVNGSEGTRLALNAFIRNKGNGLLAGYCDVEAYSGTPYNGNIVWIPNLTPDGLHPRGTLYGGPAGCYSNVFYPALAPLRAAMR